MSLWFRRPHSVIDVWLMVVMCAWLFDIALSAIVNVARFDLGFYAGRVYGLCAATFVLAVLLIENVRLQAHSWASSAGCASSRHRIATTTASALRLYGAVVESSNDAIITKTLDGIITGWNKAAEHLFGYAAAEAIGQPIDIIVPEDRRGRGQGYPEPGRRQRNDRPARDGPDPQGRPGVDVSSNSPLKSANGRDHRRLQDRPRHHRRASRHEKKLRREIEERQRIFETSQDLILVTDGFGNFIQVSPSVKTILGLPARTT